MSATKIKGRGVVYGADGAVALAGAANIYATVKSADLSADEELIKVKDSSGKVKTLIVPEVITGLNLTLVPGGTSTTAATLAEALTQSYLVRKLDNLVTSGFAVTSYNGTFVIEAASTKLTSEGVLEYSLTAMQYETTFSAAALS